MRQASTTYTMPTHGHSGLASVLRKVSEVGGDVFSKSIVLIQSDGESYTVAHDKGPLAEDIREKERELPALFCLDYSMALSVKTLDCSLHVFVPHKHGPQGYLSFRCDR
jgi:hypothetical protein